MKKRTKELIVQYWMVPAAVPSLYLVLMMLGVVPFNMEVQVWCMAFASVLLAVYAILV